MCACVIFVETTLLKKRLEEVFHNIFFREPINYMNSSYPCRLYCKQANIVLVNVVVVINQINIGLHFIYISIWNPDSGQYRLIV